MIDQEKKVEEIKKQILIGSRFRLFIVGTGILIFLILIFFIEFKKDFILRFVSVFLSYVIFIVIFIFLFKRQKEEKKIRDLNFLHILIDFIFLFFLIHYGGGISWVLHAALLGFLAYSWIVLSRKYAIFMSVFSILAISGIGAFEYFGLLPNRSPFNFGFYNDPNYVFTTIILLCGLISMISITLNFFAGNLRRQSELLEKNYRENETIKESLEIQVQARRGELGEISKKLDLEVLKKEGDLNQKMEELEETNKTTIKRELRMIELKKEIKKMKEELSKKT